MDIRVNYDCSEIHKARDKLIEKKVLRMKLCCEIGEAVCQRRVLYL